MVLQNISYTDLEVIAGTAAELTGIPSPSPSLGLQNIREALKVRCSAVRTGALELCVCMKEYFKMNTTLLHKALFYNPHLRASLLILLAIGPPSLRPLIQA